MKRLLRVFLILIVVGILAGGGYWAYTNKVAAQSSSSSSTSDGSYTQTVTASLGNLTSSVTVVGQLEAVQQAGLKFKLMAGADRLAKLTVAAGNTVKAGDVLATIDPASYQQAVDQAASDLTAVEEKLSGLQTPATELQLAQADLVIAEAGQSRAQAQADLAALGDVDLTSLEAAVKSAQDSLKLAQLQQEFARHDALAKSERDLQYSIGWHERKISDLRALIAEGKANAEQAASLSDEQEALSETQADLGKVQAERELSLRSADTAVARARVALKEASDALAAAQAGDELELAQGQFNLKNAEVALARAKQDRDDLDQGVDEADLAAARADVDKKKLALEDAQSTLDGAQLVAPFDGTVLQTSVDEGDKIAATTTILNLADLSQLQVVTSIDETTIKRIAAGQPATVTFDALPGTTLAGAVGAVPLQGALSGGVMTYEVPITLQGAENLPLLTGMTANVVIATGSVENGLLIPSMALTKSNGMYYVQVPNTVDSTAEPESVPVEVGLSDGVYTQIVRGLVEGDPVLVTVSSGTNSDTFRGIGVLLGGGGPGGAPPGRR